MSDISTRNSQSSDRKPWVFWKRIRSLLEPKQASFRKVFAAHEDVDFEQFTKTYFKTITDRVKYGEAITSIPKKSHFTAPKNPIVLCHGFSGFDRLILVPSIARITRVLNNHTASSNSEQLLENDAEDSRMKGLLEVEYWFGVKEALEAKGCTVISARVPGFASIEERANTLNEFIERETKHLRLSQKSSDIYNSPGAKNERQPHKRVKVNLIAHSMGGLDSRFLISRIPNKNFEVVSLTTVSTPHRGSEMADFLVGLASDMQKGLPTESTVKLLPPAIYELTTSSMKEFNRVTPNSKDVAYFSYGASCQPKWFNLFYASWHLMFSLSGGEPNDGLVTVRSSKWGNYMGTLQNTDHLDVINWKNRLQKEVASKVFKISDSIGEQVQPELDVLDFYLSIADKLAQRGF